MKKTLLTTALACVLTIGGLIASAQEKERIKEGQYLQKNLEIYIGKALTLDNLTVKVTDGSYPVDGKSFGYLSGSDFVTLGSAIKDKTIQLPYNQGIQFGYGTSANDFVPRSVSLTVKADPGYYAGYNSDNFFQLDFSEDPFNGLIDILVIGEPLPASTVSWLVALGAGAAFLLYHNRKRRIGAVEQA